MESESKVFEVCILVSSSTVLYIILQILSSRFVPLLEQHQSRMADELKITEVDY